VLRSLLEPGGDTTARWEALPVAARRDIVRTLFSRIALRRSADPRRLGEFDPRRLEFTWRGSERA
jgi:hypothetical protein